MANMFKEWFRALFNSPLEVDTTGPKPHEVEHVLPDLTTDKHLAGGERDWYPDARVVEVNPARVGGLCTPKAIVVHTTDTMPGGFNAIVKSWSTTVGARNAAHYLIGRNAKDGIVQFVSHRRNSNHAGGNTHGNWYINGKLFHPNSISIGIEIDAGGKLYKNIIGNWIHADTRKIVDPVDVYVDKWGNGWHRVTQYQLDELIKLINWLSINVIIGLLTKDTILPNGSYTGNRVSPWAESNKYNFLVGHVTLDPTNKTDPGPQVMEILSKW
jgi:hypothetical protein